MIIWKGLGILAIVVPFGILIIFQFIFGESSLYTGIGLIIGGILNWILGKRLNTDNERIITDPKSGQQAIQKIEHSMFWIKVELWAPIFILLGISFAISNLTNGKSEEFIIPLIGITLLLIALYTFYQKRNSLKLAFSTNPKRKSKNIPLTTPQNSEKHNKFQSSKSNKYSEISQKSKLKISEEELKKKQFYEELRSNRNKEVKYEPTDHSQYMPKNKSIESE